MNPKPFLDTLYEQHYSTAAWVWKYESNDQDALLDNNGNPNNNNNYNWGTNYKALCFKTRNP